jgi:hypothetical protein
LVNKLIQVKKGGELYKAEKELRPEDAQKRKGKQMS